MMSNRFLASVSKATSCCNVRQRQHPCVGSGLTSVLFGQSSSVGTTPCGYFRSFASSMDMLKELRAQSGAPIVDCKKALQNTNDDLKAAMDWLREHGAAKASSKVQGRETTEGLIGIKISNDGRSASIVRVASETDFAGRSSKFVDLVSDVASATLQTSSSGRLTDETILQSVTNDKTVKELLDEAIVAIRENISVKDAMKLESENGVFVGYVHNRMNSADAGTAAALVEIASLNGEVSDEVIQSIGKKLAMHIVAARPQYLLPSDVPDNEVQKEKDIILKQMGDTKKPENVITKIVDGKLRKYYESICLIEQPHMIEEKNPKVADVLKQAGVELKGFTTLSIA